MPAVTVLRGRGTVVTSKVLGLEFRDDREVRMVRLRDPTTGRNLPTYEEAEQAREEEAEARREESAGRVEAEDTHRTGGRRPAEGGSPSGGAGSSASSLRKRPCGVGRAAALSARTRPQNRPFMTPTGIEYPEETL